jgi:hypothetical protein
MTQAVQADRREPGITGQPLEVTGDVLRPQRPAIRAGEHQARHGQSAPSRDWLRCAS